MAQRRMVSLSVIDTDKFNDMPISARLLYYELCMRADDDGFVASPKKIVRMIGCSEEDLKILIIKEYAIAFENGIIVITHWKMHNYIPKDRYHMTVHINELSELIQENNIYKLCDNSNQCCIQPAYRPDTDCIQLDGDTHTEDRLGKNRIEKVKLNSITPFADKSATDTDKYFISLILNDKSFYNVPIDDVKHYKELYPAVDVEQELRSICGWLEANQQKRKTRSGIKRFITNWLSKAQNQGGLGYSNTSQNNSLQTSSNTQRSDHFKTGEVIL